MENKFNNSSIINFPFNHIIIDDFLSTDFANDVYNELLEIEKKTPDRILNTNFYNKIEFNSKIDNFDNYNKLLDLFNSDNLIKLIEKKFNFPDNFLSNNHNFYGGGYVISPPNSFLNYHTDFNYLDSIKKYRTINLILYMNKNYNENNGGYLHLIEPNSKTVEKIIQPLFNRAVIFITNKDTPHGVSINKNNFTRRSFNIYYYSDNPLDNNPEIHKTNWLNR